MRTRRKLTAIIAALAAVAATAVWGGVTPAAASGPALLPLSITNNTGRGDAVYLYVLGVNLSTGRLGYVNAGGTFTAWSPGGNPRPRHPTSPSPARATAAARRSRCRATSPAACTSRWASA